MKQNEELDSNVENNEVSNQEEQINNEDTVEENTDLNLEADLAAANDKYIRLYSEFENYKKRSLRDKMEQGKMASAEVFLSLIPIIDDLERALKSAEEAKDLKSVKEGISLIYSKVKHVTASKGLKPMEAVGKPFDAELHDAIANVPVENENQKGIVVEEIEKGYFLNDKVLRHAKVIVGQ